MVPVPVRPVRMLSMWQEHAPLAVETAPSAIRSFCSSTAPLPAGRLLFADLQLNADINTGLRLGSGRSGVYRGHYLKGVGRTLLAANWNDLADRYHRNGVLQPVAGAREWLISQFLEAEGFGQVITPCTGLLVRRLGRLANGFLGLPRSALSAADLTWRALSVKKADFCRFSNLIWLLVYMPSGRSEHSPVATFFESLWRGLYGYQTAASRQFDAGEVAVLFANTLAKAIDNFLDTWATGVHWGQVHNNYTLDGRFLDLETAIVLPRPTIGCLVRRRRRRDRGPNYIDAPPPFKWVVGFEIFKYVRQIRDATSFMKALLSRIASQSAPTSVERRFILEFLAQLDASMSGDHPVSSTACFVDRVLARSVTELDLDTSERRAVRAIYSEAARTILEQARPRRPVLEVLHRVNVGEIARPEPGPGIEVFVPAYLLERASQWRPRSLEFNEVMSAVEQATDPQAFFGLLRRAGRSWHDASQATPRPT